MKTRLLLGVTLFLSTLTVFGGRENVPVATYDGIYEYAIINKSELDPRLYISNCTCLIALGESTTSVRAIRVPLEQRVSWPVAEEQCNQLSGSYLFRVVAARVIHLDRSHREMEDAREETISLHACRPQVESSNQ